MTALIIAGAFTLAVIALPISQAIDYRRDVKKYGKEIADELARRF